MVAQSIGNSTQDLSKRRTKGPSSIGPLDVAIDENARNSDAARQGGKLSGRIFRDNLAVRRIYLLDELIVRLWGHSKLIGFARIIEILVEKRDLGLQVGFCRQDRPRGSRWFAAGR